MQQQINVRVGSLRERIFCGPCDAALLNQRTKGDRFVLLSDELVTIQYLLPPKFHFSAEEIVFIQIICILNAVTQLSSPTCTILVIFTKETNKVSCRPMGGTFDRGWNGERTSRVTRQDRKEGIISMLLVRQRENRLLVFYIVLVVSPPVTSRTMTRLLFRIVRKPRCRRFCRERDRLIAKSIRISDNISSIVKNYRIIRASHRRQNFTSLT